LFCLCSRNNGHRCNWSLLLSYKRGGTLCHVACLVARATALPKVSAVVKNELLACWPVTSTY
jgi:hypothetical protein